MHSLLVGTQEILVRWLKRAKELGLKEILQPCYPLILTQFTNKGNKKQFSGEAPYPGHLSGKGGCSEANSETKIACFLLP